MEVMRRRGGVKKKVLHLQCEVLGIPPLENQIKSEEHVSFSLSPSTVIQIIVRIGALCSSSRAENTQSGSEACGCSEESKQVSGGNGVDRPLCSPILRACVFVVVVCIRV